MKDIVLKFSGSHRQRRGGSAIASLWSESFHNHHQHQHRHGSSYTYEDATEHGHRLRAVSSSSSTPAWELSSTVDAEESRTRAKWIPGVGTAAAAAEEGVVVLEEDSEPKEWMAQVEPGVHITFVSLPSGAGNDLKRIRFSREMFNKWRAQRWWGENYDSIMELYNVQQRYNRQALQTPARSDDGERESMWSGVGSTGESPVTPAPIAAKERLAAVARDGPPPSISFAGKGLCSPSHVLPHRLHPSALHSVDAAASTTTSSVSTGNTCDLEVTEWVEEDEPGVYITIRKLADGARVLRLVRFSRDKFGEVHAKLWWEANRERIQAQYL